MMPEPLVKRGGHKHERKRTKSGRWRKKRSDAGQPRVKKNQGEGPLPGTHLEREGADHFIKKVEFMEEEKTRDIEFPKGEPEHWYAEYGVDENMLEIGLGELVIRLPQETILSWFMQKEYNVLRGDGKEDG